MQLLNITTNSIALFGAAYFLIALTAHLHHCWQHPPVKSIAAELPMLLLPPAAHPFELSLEKMPALEPIAALHQPAAELEPPSEEAIDLGAELPAKSPECPEGEAIDLGGLTSAELRKLCGNRGIKWRSAKAGKHLSKPEMIAALS